MKTKIMFVFIAVVILIAFALLVSARNATGEGDQHRAQIWLPMLKVECVRSDCAVVEPTPQQPCDRKYWWQCE